MQVLHRLKNATRKLKTPKTQFLFSPLEKLKTALRTLHYFIINTFIINVNYISFLA